MSHFAKLLKESKVVGTVDTKLEQVYTAYNGYLLNTRDFGLKRSLPKKTSPKTPWIRLKAIDTPYRQPDYRSASAETSLVKMWNQLEIGLQTARKNHAAPSHSSSAPRPIRIEFSSFDVGSREVAFSNSRISGRVPDPSSNTARRDETGRVKPILQMYQSEFDAFLQLVRTKRHEFKTFLEAKEISRRHNSSPSSPRDDESPRVDIDLYEYAQGNPDQIRRDIEEFLEHIKETSTIDHDNLDILPMPHPNLGLSYAHFDQLHNERLTPAIPGRILDQADIKSSRQTVSFAGIVGSLQRSSHIDLPSTSFEPDQNGFHNLEQGKAHFRVESAAIDPYDLPTEGAFQGFNNPADQPVRWVDPRNKPRALGTNRLKVSVREGGLSDSNRVNNNTKIGSIEWVGNPPPRRQGAIVLDFLSSITRNLPPPASSNFNTSHNSNPRSSTNPNYPQTDPQNSSNNRRLKQSQNDQLMKVLKDLVGKPPSK